MQGPFFLGENMSKADCAFVPFVERAATSLAYYKGWHTRGGGSAPSSGKRDEKSEGAAFPAVEAWFEALERRPTYLATRSDYYTHCHDLPPQLGGAPCWQQASCWPLARSCQCSCAPARMGLLFSACSCRRHVPTTCKHRCLIHGIYSLTLHASCAMHGNGEAVAAEIDGEASGAWRLPLAPLSATSLPEPYSPGA